MASIALEDTGKCYTVRDSIAYHAIGYALEKSYSRLQYMAKTNLEGLRSALSKIGLTLEDGRFGEGDKVPEFCPFFDDYPEGEIEDPKFSKEEDPVGFNIGIVGGGMGGMYTALILLSLGIPCEILEASKRVGGRVYTYKFPPLATESQEINDMQYYDVGAMRFPNIPIMKRTLDLFERLHMTKFEKEKSPPDAKPELGQLIPYKWEGKNNPSYFNHILKRRGNGSQKEDPFQVSKKAGGLIDESFINIDPLGKDPIKEILRRIFDKWRVRFIQHPNETWKDLVKLDARATSVRSYMINELQKTEEGKNLSEEELYYVTNWCETMDTATTHYDESFISLLMHSIEFQYNGSPFASSNPKPLKTNSPKYDGNWWCINGGSSILANRLYDELIKEAEKENVSFRLVPDAMVTKIANNSPDEVHPMEVTFTNRLGEKRKRRTYSHVITTSTCACLQVMDLRQAGLDYAQREAIRVLRYDNSIKVGIQFKTRWWAEENKITEGGIGKTDRPTRVVVYPSYALDTPEGKPGVLLACYNWAQDAARLASLIDPVKPAEEQGAVYRAVIADLAVMHGKTEEELMDATIKYHVHDWYGDQLTGGAFGMFGPGQFSTFYGHIRRPANRGRLIIAGEITSIYHGWIVAALNSAHRAVDQLLSSQWLLSKGNPKARKYCAWKRQQLYEKWGTDSDHEPHVHVKITGDPKPEGDSKLKEDSEPEGDSESEGDSERKEDSEPNRGSKPWNEDEYNLRKLAGWQVFLGMLPLDI